MAPRGYWGVQITGGGSGCLNSIKYWNELSLPNPGWLCRNVIVTEKKNCTENMFDGSRDATYGPKEFELEHGSYQQFAYQAGCDVE